MTKAAGVILLGLALFALAVLFAGQQQAQATPGSGCKQWKVDVFRSAADEQTLPEGWEPFTWTPAGVGLRRCIKD